MKPAQQMEIRKRKLMLNIMDALNCSQQEAITYLATLAQIEKSHPEYGIQNLPLPTLMAVLKQTLQKHQDNQSLNQTLNGPIQDSNNLDQTLGTSK